MRREVTEPAIVMTAVGFLDGQTINVSQEGALIQAKGAISILFTFQGKKFRGRLLRATPAEGETAIYAIQFSVTTEHSCVRCGSEHLRRSRVRGYERPWAWVTGKRPCRCVTCGHRTWLRS